ncbi:MAG: hypothetical protein CM15mP51_17000 [Porticoccaceae bacterium]|nr:MAG: hypothetical protein CM15mP51_17000 [Porticoccaceae bacterium]
MSLFSTKIAISSETELPLISAVSRNLSTVSTLTSGASKYTDESPSVLSDVNVTAVPCICSHLHVFFEI